VLFDVVFDAVDHEQDRVGLDEIIIPTYLLHCYCRSGLSLTSFKKLGRAGDKKIRQILSQRMLAFYPHFKRAAYVWASLAPETPVEAINPFWDGRSPPSVMSIPHLCAQDILQRVPSFFTLSLTLLVSHIES
jgi:hypothetical protein